MGDLLAGVLTDCKTVAQGCVFHCCGLFDGHVGVLIELHSVQGLQIGVNDVNPLWDVGTEYWGGLVEC